MKTAILIDDDQDDLDMLQEIVEHGESPMACFRFETGLEALDFLNARSQPVDFVFTDFNMPLMRGDEVVASIRKLEGYENTIIAVLSTFVEDDTSKKLRALGANFVIRKPSNFQDYIRLIGNLLLETNDSVR